ncbi:MAG: chemotaxis protein CheD [Cyanobacteria bacterium NC_groundwater_1444_Ag_S-0.65um_54_12]|nr:chemotaxis protein CheD [Cyanobacteria bacterium NC_groundwater_1444_Ag_S-0.65um_54_12]
MAELRVSVDPQEVFCVPGLGSCVGIVLYDPVATVAGMAHIMLPSSQQGILGDRPAKFADTAIFALLGSIVSAGAQRDRIVAKATGGSQMFRSQGEFLTIGTRNVDAMYRTLERAKIPIIAADLGGTWGRTARFFMNDWRLQIRASGRPDLDL